MEPVCVFAAFVKDYKQQPGSIDLLSVSWHVSKVTFPEDDEPELHLWEGYLVISILADVGTHELLMKNENVPGSDHEALITIDKDEGNFHRYVIRGPFDVVTMPERFLNRYPIYLDGDLLAYAYLMWLPIPVSPA